MRGGITVLLLCVACSEETSEAPSSTDGAAIETSVSDSATVADTTPTETIVEAASDAPVVERKLLIKHGQDVPYPSFVATHVAAMDAMPFDGFVVTTMLSGSVQSQTPLSRTAFDGALAPMKGAAFKNLTKNFVLVRTTPAGSWFGDHTTPANNFGVVAASARDAGLHGIVFDNEAYSGPVFNDSWCAGKPINECRDRVRAVGKQTMAAMIAAWPEVTVLVFFGSLR
jgi:hypothetical protein